MAFYEYKCADCKAIFEVNHLISEHDRLDRQPKCPECSGRKTRQLPSSFFASTKSKT